jgi:serine phosphatase RsbU (regulator of sigma subunit)
MNPVNERFEKKIEVELYHPEVSSRRLARVIHLLSERDKIESRSLLEPVMGDLWEKVLKDKNFWLSAERELSALEALDAKYSIDEIVFNTGKETFLTEAFQLLPTDDSLLNYIQIIYRLPVLLQKHVRYLDFQVISSDEKSVNIRIRYTSAENPFDLLFLKGIFEGSAILYRIKGWKMEILQTRFGGLAERLIEGASSIQIAEVPTEFRVHWDECDLEIGKTSLRQNTPNLESETFVISKKESNQNEIGKITYINLDAVLEKSRELYLENRDLEAAVEVLSSLRNDLMVKQKAISKDLKMARNIQRGIIPQHIPDWKGLQFAFSFLPMQEVSGDYYDYFNYGSNKIGIMLSDVSGHGVPAAFITAISKLLFTNYKLDSPSEIFANANRELMGLVKQQGYLTCFYGIIDSSYKMTYCIAGHPRPILLRHATGDVVVLEGEGTFLGMFADADKYYKDYTVQLEPGDKLFVYTDGILEGQSDEGVPFQQENLIKQIKRTKDMDVKSSVNLIMKEFDNFCMGTDQGDDITLLALELSLKMGDFEKHKKNADYAYSKKNYIMACEELLKANEIFPNDVNVLLLLGKYFTKDKNYLEAIKYLEEYHSLKTLNADSHLILGYCYYKIENFGKAEIELTKAIAFRGNNVNAIYSLAKVYYKQKNYEKALESVLKVISIEPEHAGAKRSRDQIQKILEKRKNSKK